MERIYIYWQDLTEEKQEEILNALSVVLGEDAMVNDYPLDSTHEVNIQLTITEEGIDVE